VLARARTALSRLASRDFLWEGEVICAVATKSETSSQTAERGESGLDSICGAS